MATHYCIGNPCWLCYPEYAPKVENKNYETLVSVMKDHEAPSNGTISGVLQLLIYAVFDQGLDEGTPLWSNRSMPLEDIKEERKNLLPDSLAAILIDKLIEYLQSYEDRKNK